MSHCPQCNVKLCRGARQSGWCDACGVKLPRTLAEQVSREMAQAGAVRARPNRPEPILASDNLGTRGRLAVGVAGSLATALVVVSLLSNTLRMGEAAIAVGVIAIVSSVIGYFVGMLGPRTSYT